MSALFANDGAALILTPIVIAMLRALGYRDKATLAFVMAAGFVADTGQPAADRVQPGQHRVGRILPHRLRRLRLGDGSGGFSRRSPRRWSRCCCSSAAMCRLATTSRSSAHPADAIRDPATFKAGWRSRRPPGGFFLLEPIGVPVSAVAAAGAILLLAIAARGHVIETRKVVRDAPWQVVFFSLGMYLVVYGLRNAGLTDHLAGLLDRAAQGGVWGAAFGTGIIAALLSWS